MSTAETPSRIHSTMAATVPLNIVPTYQYSCTECGEALEVQQSFSDDPLRMMRAARFASQLGFTVVPEVVAAMAAMADRLEIVSVERIADDHIELVLRLESHGADALRPHIEDSTGALLEPLDSDGRMKDHHRLEAVRGHLLERAGQRDRAHTAYLAAARMTNSGFFWSESSLKAKSGATLLASSESKASILILTGIPARTARTARSISSEVNGS